MIAATHTATDRSQLERKELARGAWRDGQIENALLIIRSVLSEQMSPAVAAECYSAEAGFLADLGDFAGSLESLERMAPFLDSASVKIQGTFYNARARANRNLNDLDAALTDYAGALALWQSCGEKNYEGAVLINVSELYLIIGDHVQAEEYIERALKALPSRSEYLPNAFDTKAKVLLATGKPALALKAIETAILLAGDNEVEQKSFSVTRAKIKERLIDLLVPLVTTEDLEEMKVQMIRHALDKTNGSITAAAELIHTSHQVVDYTARKHGLERAPRRRKSIIKHTR